MAQRVVGATTNLSTAGKFCDVETLLDHLVALRLSNNNNKKQITRVIAALTRLQLQKHLVAKEGNSLRRLWRIWTDILVTGQSSITNLEHIILAECSDFTFAQNILYHALSMTDTYDNFKSSLDILPPAATFSEENAVSHITAPTLAAPAKSRVLSTEILRGKVLAAWIQSGGSINNICDSQDVIQKLVRYRHHSSCMQRGLKRG